MKKTILILLVVFVSFAMTTSAQTQPIPSTIDADWIFSMLSNHEKYDLMALNNKIRLYQAEQTLERYQEIVDPVRGAHTPMMRLQNEVIIKYGVDEQKAQIEQIKNEIDASLESDRLAARNHIATLYNAKRNIAYRTTELDFANRSLRAAREYYERGVTAYGPVRSAEYSVNVAKDALADAERAYQNARMNVNLTIGADLLQTYTAYNITESLLIDHTRSIRSMAEEKFQSLILAKEYEIEKEEFRKRTLQSYLSIYIFDETIPEEIEKIEERIESLRVDIALMKFYDRPTYEDKAQAIIDQFEAIGEQRKNIGELYDQYNDLLIQHAASDVGAVPVLQKEFDIRRAEDALRRAIFDFNTRYMAYVLEMQT